MYSTPASGTLIKGASIRARLKFLEREYGSDQLDLILVSLSEEDQSTIRIGVLPSTWYPLELSGRLDEAVAQVLSPDAPSRIFRLLGKASAENNLQSFHRIFLRGQGPHDVLESFPSVRRTYYSDGSAAYTPDGEQSGTLCVSGASSHTRSDCESTAAYFEKAIELMGGRSARTELKRCRDFGDASCEFHCQWQ